MMQEYFLFPDDHYLLPPTIGAASLHMATIDARGAASMGFHLAPKYLELDPYSGDFGVGFYGHVQLAASIYTIHPIHGPLCYLCDVRPSSTDGGVAVTTIIPRDSIRRRVFIEPYGVLVEVMAGAIVSVTVDTSARTFSLHLKDDGLASNFRIKILTPSHNRPGQVEGVVPTPALRKVRGALEVPVTPTATVVFTIGKGQQSDTNASHPTVAHNNGRKRVVDSAYRWSAELAVVKPANLGCTMDVPAVLPDQAHSQMDLANAPDLPGFEGGFACASAVECSQKCADQISADAWHHLACQAWTFVEAKYNAGHPWCWLRGGRGNAVGKCGYTSATCDNRPAPATDWPCCQNGFTCPDPMSPNSTLVE